MNNSYNAEDLFSYSNSLCSLQLVVAMVLDDKLQSVTSSIYPSLNDAGNEQRLKLKNLYYVPNSQVAITSDTSMYTLISNVYGELGKLSNVYIDDATADSLVSQTASENAQEQLTLTLGNAAVKVALSAEHGMNYTPATKAFDFFGDPSFVLSDIEQKSLALLVFEVANNNELYKTVQTLINENNEAALADQFAKVELPNNSTLSSDASQKLASLTLAGNNEKLVTYIGTNIFKPSW
ncbi:MULTISPECIES: hypothetical protein [Pseudoalteromonas]|uniref:Uncharacterized protein n=1 Tax=Pseudoalteromonas amylolytica TaxID=1859457 RepID=A0A1S1MKF5_9GAMM|nr:MULTISPECIES: hypothetical protein [Pseudoalteromonas]OHU84321.1 hypothetical protein BFC16_01395 [Pseudoalteromonas sp. JW3]OHU87140.1 hypothetical protein BET10_00545 [Pseudoalteromonas amylolytica]